ncbi:hypothetical protein AC1031_006905 [Aphanomyces cochlioides]|nr:hypothetical protein AC1031_006905 [Aphanomyces cochlioides]
MDTALVDADLQRVFRFLNGYAIRARLRRLENLLQSKMQQLADATSHVPAAWSHFPNDAFELLELLGEGETVQASIDAVRQEMSNLKLELDKSCGISFNDLMTALRDMNMPLSKAEVEHMIWEVDEDLDGCVSFDECKAMFTRCIGDTQGVEPTQFYHVFQFLIYDQNFNFAVTVGELAQRSLVRHNEGLLNRQLSLLFGKGESESLISLATYWNVVNTNMPRLFDPNLTKL